MKWKTSKPTIGNLFKVCEVLRCDISDLLGDLYEKIRTEDVARELGVDAQFLRHIVEEKKVDFGICITTGKSKRRNFVYFPEKLREVLGEDAVRRISGGAE